MIKYTILWFAFFLSTNINAQSILQDNKGATSISLNPGKEKEAPPNNAAGAKETVEFGLGQIKLSTVEKKLEVNYYHYFRKKKGSYPSFVGISASGEIKNSIASMLSSGDVSPGSSLKLKLGKRLWRAKIADFDEWEADFKSKNGGVGPTPAQTNTFVNGLSKAQDLWFVVGAGLDGSKFKLFYPDSAFSKQVQKVNFTTVNVNAGLNYWASSIVKSTWLIGVTVGYKLENNFDDLSESVAEDVTVRTNPTDTTTRKVTEKITVYKGKYKETKSYPLNVDFYLKPHKFENIAFLVYCRHVMFRSELPQTKVGAGIYFLRKNNLFDPVFGLNVDYSDIFNNDPTDDDKSNFSKLKVGLVMDLNTLLFQKRN